MFRRHAIYDTHITKRPMTETSDFSFHFCPVRNQLSSKRTGIRCAFRRGFDAFSFLKKPRSPLDPSRPATDNLKQHLFRPQNRQTDSSGLQSSTVGHRHCRAGRMFTVRRKAAPGIGCVHDYRAGQRDGCTLINKANTTT